MNNERSIYLIRHGHTGEEGGPKRYVGTTDVMLSDTGMKQAQALARWLEDRPVTGVYCSGLSRCVKTAGEIAKRLDQVPVTIPALHEIHMGKWENKTFEEIQALKPQEFEKRGRSIANHRPPGGESFAECEKRVWPAFMGILQETAGNVAVVAHAGVNRVLLCSVLGLDLNNIFCLRQDYGCLNIIGYGKDTFTVKLMNFVPERDCLR